MAESRPNHNPTPAEIRRECERIQQEWTPEDEQRRRVIQQKPASFPVVKTPRVE